MKQAREPYEMEPRFKSKGSWIVMAKLFQPQDYGKTKTRSCKPVYIREDNMVPWFIQVIEIAIVLGLPMAPRSMQVDVYSQGS